MNEEMEEMSLDLLKTIIITMEESGIFERHKITIEITDKDGNRWQFEPKREEKMYKRNDIEMGVNLH